MSLENYAGILEQNRFRAYNKAMDELKRARAEILEIEVQLSLAYNGNPYQRIGRVHTLDAGIVFNAFGAIENYAEFKAQYDEEARERLYRGSDDPS